MNIVLHDAIRREYEADIAAQNARHRFFLRTRIDDPSIDPMGMYRAAFSWIDPMSLAPIAARDFHEREYAFSRAKFARYAAEGGKCSACGETGTRYREGRCMGVPGSEHAWQPGTNIIADKD